MMESRRSFLQRSPPKKGASPSTTQPSSTPTSVPSSSPRSSPMGFPQRKAENARCSGQIYHRSVRSVRNPWRLAFFVLEGRFLKRYKWNNIEKEEHCYDLEGGTLCVRPNDDSTFIKTEREMIQLKEFVIQGFNLGHPLVFGCASDAERDVWVQQLRLACLVSYRLSPDNSSTFSDKQVDPAEKRTLDQFSVSPADVRDISESSDYSGSIFVNGIPFYAVLQYPFLYLFPPECCESGKAVRCVYLRSSLTTSNKDDCSIHVKLALAKPGESHMLDMAFSTRWEWSNWRSNLASIQEVTMRCRWEVNGSCIYQNDPLHCRYYRHNTKPDRREESVREEEASDEEINNVFTNPPPIVDPQTTIPPLPRRVSLDNNDSLLRQVFLKSEALDKPATPTFLVDPVRKRGFSDDLVQPLAVRTTPSPLVRGDREDSLSECVFPQTQPVVQPVLDEEARRRDSPSLGPRRGSAFTSLPSPKLGSVDQSSRDRCEETMKDLQAKLALTMKSLEQVTSEKVDLQSRLQTQKSFTASGTVATQTIVFGSEIDALNRLPAVSFAHVECQTHLLPSDEMSVSHSAAELLRNLQSKNDLLQEEIDKIHRGSYNREIQRLLETSEELKKENARLIDSLKTDEVDRRENSDLLRRRGDELAKMHYEYKSLADKLRDVERKCEEFRVKSLVVEMELANTKQQQQKQETDLSSSSLAYAKLMQSKSRSSASTQFPDGAERAMLCWKENLILQLISPSNPLLHCALVCTELVKVKSEYIHHEYNAIIQMMTLDFQSDLLDRKRTNAFRSLSPVRASGSPLSTRSYSPAGASLSRNSSGEWLEVQEEHGALSVLPRKESANSGKFMAYGKGIPDIHSERRFTPHNSSPDLFAAQTDATLNALRQIREIRIEMRNISNSARHSKAVLQESVRSASGSPRRPTYSPPPRAVHGARVSFSQFP